MFKGCCQGSCNCFCSCSAHAPAMLLQLHLGGLMQCAPASALTMLLLMMSQGCCLGSCKCICDNSAHALARLMQLPLQRPSTRYTRRGVEEGCNRGVKGLMQCAHATALTMLLLMTLKGCCQRLIQLLLQLLCPCSCYAHAMLLLMMLEGCCKDLCNCS